MKVGALTVMLLFGVLLALLYIYPSIERYVTTITISDGPSGSTSTTPPVVSLSSSGPAPTTAASTTSTPAPVEPAAPVVSKPAASAPMEPAAPAASAPVEPAAPAASAPVEPAAPAAPAAPMEPVAAAASDSASAPAAPVESRSIPPEGHVTSSGVTYAWGSVKGIGFQNLLPTATQKERRDALIYDVTDAGLFWTRPGTDISRCNSDADSWSGSCTSQSGDGWVMTGSRNLQEYGINLN